MDEGALIARLPAGDREALGELLMAHREACYALALRLAARAEDAEDVCQDAFLRASRDAAGFRPEGSFRSWLFGLVVCAHRDRLRSERARRRREGERAMEREAAAVSAADGKIEQVELRRKLDDSLRALDEDRALPIVLHYERGLTHSEVAAALAIPEGTVKTNIRRGIEELRAMLARAGYGAAALGAGAIEGALAQGPVVSTPASLTTFIKALASGSSAKALAATGAGTKTAATTITATSAGPLALTWKIATAASLAALLGLGGREAWRHWHPAVAPAPTRPAAKPADPMETCIEVCRTKPHVQEILAEAARGAGVRFAIGPVYGQVDLVQGRVTVRRAVEAVCASLRLDSEVVRGDDGGVTICLWPRPDRELLDELLRKARSREELDRCVAARWLPVVDGRAALVEAARLVADPSERVRVYAVAALRHREKLLGAGNWRDSRLRCLPAPEMRAALAEALGAAAATYRTSRHRLPQAVLDRVILAGLAGVDGCVEPIASILEAEAGREGMRWMPARDGKPGSGRWAPPTDPEVARDPSSMQYCSTALGRIGGTAARERLAGALKLFNQPGDRATVMIGLGAMGTPEADRILLALAGDPAEPAASAAFRELCRRDTTVPVGQLIAIVERMAGRPKIEAKETAIAPFRLPVRELAWTDSPEAAEWLVKYAESKMDPTEIRGVCIGLSTSPRLRGAVSPLAKKLLSDKNPAVRRDGVEALGWTGSPEAVPLLSRLLAENAGKQGDELARTAAIALSRCGADGAEDTLIAALKQGGPLTRAAAAEALGQTDATRAASELRLALEDKVPEVRASAAAALGKMGRQEDIEALLTSAGKSPGKPADACYVAIGRIGGPRAADALRQAAGRGIGPAAFALLTSGDTDCRKTLKEMLNFPNGAAGLVRALALWEQPPGSRYNWPAGAAFCRAVPAMVALLEDPDPRVRQAVARGFADIGLDPRALPALAAMLKGNDDPMTKHWAVDALGFYYRNGIPDPLAAAPLAEYEAALKRAREPRPDPKRRPQPEPVPEPPEVF